MAHFDVREHIVRTQHTRERASGAERGRENDLRLYVKQYVPKTNTDPKPNDVTIIGAQANGFPLQMYEPFWDDVHDSLRAHGRNIRGIWIADMANQAQSGIINEKLLGPGVSWWDHGRDLLYFINQFQDEMPHPLIGIGHSVGASHLTFARLSTSRRDIWPTRQKAIEKFKSNKFYQAWDPRVLDKWIEYGLRDLPTEQYPELPKDRDSSDPPVTLSTTTAQEVYLYTGAYYHDDRLLQDESLAQEIHPDDQEDALLGRPETQTLHRRLPELKPSTLFVFGSQSPASPPDLRRDKLERTGTGVGGSGGAAKGKVQEALLDCGHLIAFEDSNGCAEACTTFMGKELEKWEIQEREFDERLKGLSRQERVGINELWKKNLEAEHAKMPADQGSKL